MKGAIIPLPRIKEKAEGNRTRFKGILWNIEQEEEVAFAQEARYVTPLPTGGGSRRGVENIPAMD
jgi:hypothetical protein